ncbi:MAG: hypothetical protein CSYNP_02827 [Syntrophus sp. SKADARSKE-3]|nr:hypothetical protein [Syntrophus sp. SKADARSKE-3]
MIDLAHVDDYLREAAFMHGLPEPVILEEMQQSFSLALRKVFNREMDVWFEKRSGAYEMQIIAHKDSLFEGIKDYEFDPKNLKKNVIRLMQGMLNSRLHRRVTLEEFMECRKLHSGLYQGRVCRKSDDGKTLYADVMYENMLGYRKYVLGILPFEKQPIHERGRVTIGDLYWYHVTDVRGESDEEDAKVLVILSRLSQSLPALLATRFSYEDNPDRIVTVKCTKRIAGGYCELQSSRPIPVKVLARVKEELNEFVGIKVTSGKEGRAIDKNAWAQREKRRY